MGLVGPSDDDDPEIHDRDTIPAPSTKSVTHRPDVAASSELQMLPPTLPGLDAASLVALDRGDDEDDQDQIDTLRPPPLPAGEGPELGWHVESPEREDATPSPWTLPAHGLVIRPPPPAGFESVASLAPAPVTRPGLEPAPASLAPAVRETHASSSEPAARKRSPIIAAAVLLLAGGGLAGLLASNSSNARETSSAAPPRVTAPESSEPAARPAPSAPPVTVAAPVVQPLPTVVIEAPEERKPMAPRRRGRAGEALAEPELEEPSRQDVVDSLNALRDELRACTQGRSGIAEIDLTIAGTGAVSYAVVGGDYQGAQGSCIARTARKAKVAPFKKPRVRVLYRLSL